ncbi:MAG: response regulator [Deinococcus sp.]|nr:response regulator [Deinococcus sp.]
MDIRMPGLDGVKATQLIVRTVPSAWVLILTMYRQDDYVVEAIAAADADMDRRVRGKSTLPVHKASLWYRTLRLEYF